MKAPKRGPQSAAKGILWMLFGCFFLASVNIFAKTLSADYSITQVVWARYVFHIVMLLAVLGIAFPRTLKTTHIGFQSLRSLLMIVATACYFSGISHIPLADASAIMFLVPILVTALAAPFLGERIGYRRWLGVVFGFAGALIIIRPGTDMMQTGALFMLGAAFCQMFYQVFTRRVSDSNSAATSLVYSALGGTIILSVVVPFVWIQPSLIEWGMMAMMGTSAGIGHFAMIKAYQVAPAPTVAPYFYSHLIWSTIFGYSFFATVPSIWTLSGAAVIVTSGLYIYHREQLRKREQAQ